MFKQFTSFLVLFLSITVFISCSSDDSDNQVTNDDPPIDNNVSLATNGCLNVVIFNDFAYAACGGEIEIVNLNTLERNLLNISADDITVDTSTEQLFTQTGSLLQVLNLDNPMQPNVVATTNTNFNIFSGLSAANGILVVSGGSTNSDTQIYNYTASSISLVTDGIPVVDNITGNPDVHVTATANGAKAFYSQDIGQVANWAIQIVEFDVSGQVLATPQAVVLTPRQYTGTFQSPVGPANFPIESEFLDNQLYVASFAARGVEVIDLDNNNALSLIPLPYEPINIGTDGTSLFVIGLTNDDVDIIDPSTATVTGSLQATLTQPTGVAASLTHIAIADRTEGLVIITR
ncbi:hypothetical protein D7030_01925 [Flavobacteriaceae bacterium AU392]|nr:hypothetical protein D1817_08400 [Flavobacteriaceae bacterium]RKM85454.1 hypothetical protein D7030_01925 [Flavobacteriaceae bacterium AU392]